MNLLFMWEDQWENERNFTYSVSTVTANYSWFFKNSNNTFSNILTDGGPLIKDHQRKGWKWIPSYNLWSIFTSTEGELIEERTFVKIKHTCDIGIQRWLAHVNSSLAHGG